jgi:transcriptional regulator with XRE-family HTH domain
MLNLESIQAYREQSGLSQSQLGDRLGVTGQTVAAWEKGDRDLSVAQLLRLAQVLGMQVECFLSGASVTRVCLPEQSTLPEESSLLFRADDPAALTHLTRLERLVYLALLREEITL